MVWCRYTPIPVPSFYLHNVLIVTFLIMNIAIIMLTWHKKNLILLIKLFYYGNDHLYSIINNFKCRISNKITGGTGDECKVLDCDHPWVNGDVSFYPHVWYDLIFISVTTLKPQIGTMQYEDHRQVWMRLNVEKNICGMFLVYLPEGHVSFDFSLWQKGTPMQLLILSFVIATGQWVSLCAPTSFI